MGAIIAQGLTPALTPTAMETWGSCGRFEKTGNRKTLDNGRMTTRLQSAHNWQAPAMGVAKTFEQDSEARADVLFNLKMESGREWHQAILGNFRSGLTQEWSFAFDILQDDPAFARKIDAKRAFRKLDVHEISPVLKGAGIKDVASQEVLDVRFRAAEHRTAETRLLMSREGERHGRFHGSH